MAISDWIFEQEVLFAFHTNLCLYLFYKKPIIKELKTTCFYTLYKVQVENKSEIFIKIHTTKYEIFYNGKSIYSNIDKRQINELHCKILEVLSNDICRNLFETPLRDSNNMELLKEFIGNEYLYVSNDTMFRRAK